MMIYLGQAPWPITGETTSGSSSMLTKTSLRSLIAKNNQFNRVFGKFRASRLFVRAVN